MSENVYRNDLFQNKVAFVAGGTSGINLGIAEKLGRLGAKVFVISRSSDKVESAIMYLNSFNIDASGMAADVRDYDAVDTAFEACVKKFGEIDILVSGAAGNFVSNAIDMSSNAFKTVIDIDLIGTFNVCRAAYSRLSKSGASVVNISAVQAFTPMPGQSHVCAAKAGIDALTKVLAIEWGPAGIRVNAIAPGPVAGTEGMARLTPTSEHEKAFINTIPLRRYASIDEIADTVVFLSSETGSNYNGEVLVCDGGQSLLGGGGFSRAWEG